MKRYAIILVMTALAIGCAKVEQPAPEPDTLSVNKDEFVFSAEGGNFTVTLTHTGSYSVEIEADEAGWVHSVFSKALDTELSFAVDPNEGYDDRYAVISISSPNSLNTKVNVIQKQKDAIVLAADRFEIGKEGGEISIELQTNVDLTIDIDQEGDWLSEVRTRGLQTRTLKFAAPAHDGDKTREATIRFSKGDVVEEVTVYQIGEPVLVLSASEMTVSATGGPLEVDLTTNTEYDIIMPEADWLTYKPDTKGIVTGTLSFDVQENATYDSRSAEIVFKSKDGRLSQTVKVVQSQKDAIIVSADGYAVGYEAGSLQFVLSSNVEYSMTIDVDWISEVRTKALVDRELQFSYERNPVAEERTGTIRFEYGDIVQEVRIVQDALVQKEYVLAVTHANDSFILPLFDGTIYFGKVFWGDGSEDEYGSGLVHDFEDLEEVRTEIHLTAGEDPLSVTFKDIVGVSEIDFSEM